MMSSATTLGPIPVCFTRFPKGCCRTPVSLSNSAYSSLSENHRNGQLVARAINMTAGQSEGPGKVDVSRMINMLRKAVDNLPQPVKIFPWAKALMSFYELTFELVCAVAKYLSVPLLAISSLSEMSYCAHERKMRLIPIPFLVGFAVAGILKDTVKELSPDLKKGEFPGHLVLLAMLFVLLKLPGPYYPYWGRLIIPHFANGALWRIAGSAFMGYRQSKGTPAPTLEAPTAKHPSEEKE